jgi:hypothetical protein
MSGQERLCSGKAFTTEDSGCRHSLNRMMKPVQPLRRSAVVPIGFSKLHVGNLVPGGLRVRLPGADVFVVPARIWNESMDQDSTCWQAGHTTNYDAERGVNGRGMACGGLRRGIIRSQSDRIKRTGKSKALRWTLFVGQFFGRSYFTFVGVAPVQAGRDHSGNMNANG